MDHFYLFCLCIFGLIKIHTVSGFLNIEELKNVNYGIDIVNIPVSPEYSEHVAANSMMVSSKFGQKYMCSFPDSDKHEKEKEEEEKLAKEIGIPELLKPLETGACLIKTKDWWSYEFCYGRYIRQYHVEDSKIVSEIIYLGYYESEFDWNDDDGKEERKENKNMLNRYHSQQYVNGSECDLTERRRQTEVRFMCEEGSGDYIARIDEPETCKYILTVHTTRICHHPYLKPPKQTKPITITCNPLLTKAQYQEYVLDKEEEEKAHISNTKTNENIDDGPKSPSDKDADHVSFVERPVIGKEVDSDNPAQVFNENDDVNIQAVDTESMDKDGIAVDDFDNVEDLLSKSLTNGMKSFVQKMAAQPTDDKTQFKIFKDTKDLKHSLNEKDLDENLDENEDNQALEEELPEEDEKQKQSETLQFKKHKKESDSKDPAESTDDTENLEVTEDLDKEIEKLKASYSKSKERFQKMKDKLKKAMHSQFDDIVNEASEELAKDGVNIDNVDKDVAFKELASTLNTLLKKLEKTEKEITDVDSELEKISSNSEKNTEDDGSPSSSSQEKDKDTEVPKSTEGNVKVRVTRIKSGDTIKEGKEVENVHTKQLENVVKQGLEKAGLETGDEEEQEDEEEETPTMKMFGGNKVQVRIITAGYYDSDDDSIHILSDKDTSSFQNMIVAILSNMLPLIDHLYYGVPSIIITVFIQAKETSGKIRSHDNNSSTNVTAKAESFPENDGGDNEASEEQRKHKQMENTYSFVYGKSNKKKSSLNSIDGADQNL